MKNLVVIGIITKTITIKRFLFFLMLATAFGCMEKDEDPSSIIFPGVPTGDIVSIDLRDEILTGSREVTGGRVKAVLKWWKHDISKIGFNECDEEDLDLTIPNAYLSFSPDARIFVKVGVHGSAQDSFVTWQWESNRKNGIVLSSDPTVVFTFTALNANEVVYASRQEAEGCIVITWERFNEPYIDQ